MYLANVLLISSFLTVHSLKCYCAEFIDSVDLTWEQCGSDKSCETITGMCYANLRITEQGVQKHNFNCIEGDIENVVSSIRITCNTSPTDSQIVKCCNNTDFCNQYLFQLTGLLHKVQWLLLHLLPPQIKVYKLRCSYIGVEFKDVCLLN